jgi:hypothetical protein
VGEPFPADEDVERVMDIILHARGHQDALWADLKFHPPLSTRTVRRFVIDILRKIRKCTVTHPGSERRQLLNAAKAIEKARVTLAELPLSPSVADDLICKLARVRDECKRRAGRTVVKHSGGQIVAAAQKRIAAEHAMHLLLLCGEKPTLSRGKAYLKLAALLFEVATGKRANLERACAECCDEAAAAMAIKHLGAAAKN